MENNFVSVKNPTERPLNRGANFVAMIVLLVS